MRSLVRPRFGAVIGAALLALVLAHPNHALAGTATVNGSVLGYTALPGETNDVSVEHWNAGLPDDFWVLNDYGAPVVPGPGCEPFAFGLAGHSVDCGTPSSVNADLADLDDRFRVQDLRAVVLGGAGDDALHASALADSLDGGAGNDSLYAGRGSDDVEGGPGDDTIDAEACNGSSCGPDGTDSYAGGDGVDTISFGHRHAAVWVSLNDVADDGEPGELDNIASDIENATGGEGGDTIVGNDGPNVLDGGADYGGGPNTIQGLGGNDLLRGGMGCCDDLEGGAGDDALFAGMSGGGVLDGGGGDDTMIPSFLGVPPPVNVIGGDGVDTADFSGSFGSVSISLDDVANDGTGSDNVHADVENVTAGGGNDTLVGNSADNVLDGGPGTDSVQGGAGTDTVSYASRGVAVTVTLDGIADDGDQASQENDNIGVDVENVAGGSGPDKLVGNAGANVLNGGPGDDVLDGALGADVMRGGDGAHDAATYASRTTAVNVSFDGAANDGVVGEDDNVGTDVEDLVGGSANDTLTGNEADNLLDGGPGGDDMSGGGGVDGVSYASRSASVTVSLDGAANDGAAGEGDHVATDVENVVGGLGNDELVGNAGPNTLDGGDGNDLLDGGLGADTLIGGPGDFDTVDFSARTSSVTVALLGSAGSGQGGENDTIGADVEDAIGGAGADSFVGNTSDNIFDGGLGGDTFDGGRGFDLVDYSTRAKPVIVSLDGRRNDGVAGERDNVATGVEAVAGGRGKDTLRGDGYANALDGGPGADAIYGAAGADVLLGEGGRDKLVGGRGRDTISGGRGNDVIRSRDRVVDTVVCGAGRDAVLADALELVSKDCERVDRGKCVVPKVVGKPLVSAVNAIAVAGCRVGKITKVKSSKTKNTVVGQTPHPGKRLKFGSKVSLRVSRGR